MSGVKNTPGFTAALARLAATDLPTLGAPSEAAMRHEARALVGIYLKDNQGAGARPETLDAGLVQVVSLLRAGLTPRAEPGYPTIASRPATRAELALADAIELEIARHAAPADAPKQREPTSLVQLARRYFAGGL